MNKDVQQILQQKASYQPDKDWFLFHPSYAYTSQNLKRNRVYAHLVKKLLMLMRYRRYETQVRRLCGLLLRYLTHQYYTLSDIHQPKNQAELLYFHEMFVLLSCRDHDKQEVKELLLQLQDLFQNQNSGHKKLYKTWKKKLSILLNDETNNAAVAHINNQQYKTDFLNNVEYQKIQQLFL